MGLQHQYASTPTASACHFVETNGSDHPELTLVYVANYTDSDTLVNKQRRETNTQICFYQQSTDQDVQVYNVDYDSIEYGDEHAG